MLDEVMRFLLENKTSMVFLMLIFFTLVFFLNYRLVGQTLLSLSEKKKIIDENKKLLSINKELTKINEIIEHKKRGLTKENARAIKRIDELESAIKTLVKKTDAA